MHTNHAHKYLPRPNLEDAVDCFLLHWLEKVQEIAGDRSAAFSAQADNFHPDGPRVTYSAYIKGVPATATEYVCAKEAFDALSDRANDLTVCARVAALRAEANELERGAQ
jgi:hypothetical protein